MQKGATTYCGAHRIQHNIWDGLRHRHTALGVTFQQAASTYGPRRRLEALQDRLLSGGIQLADSPKAGAKPSAYLSFT